jgi:PilZ domain
MQYDRRKAKRIQVNLSGRWEGAIEQREATVTSLSVNGCFILSGGETAPKELVRLEIDLPGGPAYFWAEVVEQAYDIGFALWFTAADESDQARLETYITDNSI